MRRTDGMPDSGPETLSFEFTFAWIPVAGGLCFFFRDFFVTGEPSPEKLV